MFLPKTRNADIIVQEAGSELLIYDLRINRAFALNDVSRIIYQACDGKTSYADLQKDHRSLTDDVLRFGINKLSRKNLFEDGGTKPFSRRKLVSRAAAAAVALPVVTLVIIPSAAHAQSSSC